MWSWLGGGAASTAKEPEKDKPVIPTARTLTTGNTSPNASRSSSIASFKRPDSEKSPVVYVTDRICAFVFGKSELGTCRLQIPATFADLAPAPAAALSYLLYQSAPSKVLWCVICRGGPLYVEGGFSSFHSL